MIYNDDFFYLDNIPKSFTITDNHLKKLSKLEASIEEGSYYDYVVSWSLEDVSIEELSELYVVIQFLTMTAEIDPKFLENHPEYQNYHVSLLRKLYLGFDENIHMDYKRPFGNSNILGDVAEEMNQFIDIDSRITPLDLNIVEKVEKVKKALKTFSQMLVDLIKENGFIVKYRFFSYNLKSSGDYVFKKNTHPYLRNSHKFVWKVNISDQRDYLIDKILEK